MTACAKCGGALRIDPDDVGTPDAGLAPSMVCRDCSTRIYLDATGQPLRPEPLRMSERAELLAARIRAMALQGIGQRVIARELRTSNRFVNEVLMTGGLDGAAK